MFVALAPDQAQKGISLRPTHVSRVLKALAASFAILYLIADLNVVNDRQSGLNQVDMTASAVLLKPTTENAASEELKCLAQNIYFEARGEPVEGKLAVAHVVMNRVASPRFPNTVCGVVHQGGYAARHRCQFSWWCDGKNETIADRGAWVESLDLAHRVYRNRSDDPSGNALWYHADYVSPAWRSDFAEGPKIGRHIFYSERTSVASMVEIASNQSIN